MGRLVDRDLHVPYFIGNSNQFCSFHPGKAMKCAVAESVVLALKMKNIRN